MAFHQHLLTMQRKQYNQEFTWANEKKKISRQCTIKHGNIKKTMQHQVWKKNIEEHVPGYIHVHCHSSGCASNLHFSAVYSGSKVKKCYTTNV